METAPELTYNQIVEVAESTFRQEILWRTGSDFAEQARASYWRNLERMLVHAGVEMRDPTVDYPGDHLEEDVVSLDTPTVEQDARGMLPEIAGPTPLSVRHGLAVAAGDLVVAAPEYATVNG